MKIFNRNAIVKRHKQNVNGTIAPQNQTHHAECLLMLPHAT